MCKLLQPRKCQNRQVLSAAKKEIGKTAAKAFALIWKISEPLFVIFLKFTNRVVPIWSTYPKNPVDLEASMDFPKVEWQQRLGQMFDNMMRIKCIHSRITKR